MTGSPPVKCTQFVHVWCTEKAKYSVYKLWRHFMRWSPKRYSTEYGPRTLYLEVASAAAGIACSIAMTPSLRFFRACSLPSVGYSRRYIFELSLPVQIRCVAVSALEFENRSLKGRTAMVKGVRVSEVGGTEKLKFEDVEVGKPGSGQARVKHTAIGLNMIDTYFRSGVYKTELPFIPGMEAAGVVEEVASDVTEVRVGDRVCYAGPLGAYSEERLIASAKLVKIPDGVDDVTAAAIFLKGMTTQVLLHKVFKVEKGQTILVHAAAGGMGSLMVQWASNLGATVIGVVSTEEKAKKAKADGAHHVILYSDKNLVQRVKEITNGAGVPVVYDSVGKDTFQDSLDCLAIRGMFVSYGQSSGAPAPIATSVLAAKALFLTRPSLMHYTAKREELEEVSSDLFAKVANGALKIRVHATYPLSQAAKAQDDLEGRKTTGSTVFLPDALFN